jgi:hypothetical protein
LGLGLGWGLGWGLGLGLGLGYGYGLEVAGLHLGRRIAQQREADATRLVPVGEGGRGQQEARGLELGHGDRLHRRCAVDLVTARARG